MRQTLWMKVRDRVGLALWNLRKRIKYGRTS